MIFSVHPTDERWEKDIKKRYGKAYAELTSIFRQILFRAFIRCHWIPEPLALDYLTRILIEFLPAPAQKENMIIAMAEGAMHEDNPESIIRTYEKVGELILWLSGLYRQRLYQAEGKRSFEIAYEKLHDYEDTPDHTIVIPGKSESSTSKRLKVNKMFSEQFENYQEIIEAAGLIDDPVYLRYRNMFMTDDFSSN